METSYIVVALVQLLTGALSTIGCALVILTYVIFHDLHRLRYMEFVFYVAINDFLASIGMGLGHAADGSAACWYQAISTNFNFLSSMFWTVIICYQVWLIIEQKLVIKEMWMIHTVCWGLPLLVTLLPLTTNRYGNVDDEGSWCFIDNRSNSPPWGILFWNIMAFYFWVWMSIFINAYFLVRTFVRLRRMGYGNNGAASYTLNKLVLYPIITVCCWTPICILDLYQRSASTENANSDFILYLSVVFIAITTLQGIANACVFFAMNRIVREKWWALLTRCEILTLEQYPEGGGPSGVVGGKIGGDKRKNMRQSRATASRKSEFVNRYSDAERYEYEAEAPNGNSTGPPPNSSSANHSGKNRVPRRGRESSRGGEGSARESGGEFDDDYYAEDEVEGRDDSFLDGYDDGYDDDDYDLIRDSHSSQNSSLASRPDFIPPPGSTPAGPAPAVAAGGGGGTGSDRGGGATTIRVPLPRRNTTNTIATRSTNVSNRTSAARPPRAGGGRPRPNRQARDSQSSREGSSGVLPSRTSDSVFGWFGRVSASFTADDSAVGAPTPGPDPTASCTTTNSSLSMQLPQQSSGSGATAVAVTMVANPMRNSFLVSRMQQQQPRFSTTAVERSSEAPPIDDDDSNL